MFVEYKKMSKKAQKELNNSKRVMWDCNPCSKVVPNKKLYNRKSKNNFDF